MLNTHSHKPVMYHFPVETALFFLHRGQPVPVDLQEELASQGVNFEELKAKAEKDEDRCRNGFSIFTL